MIKNKYNILAFLLLGGLIFNSCEVEFDDGDVITPANGEADFSTYVSIGNSLTAGIADGALYEEAQRVSFPVILHEQMQKTGSIDPFTVPYAPGNGLGGATVGKLALSLDPADRLDCKGDVSLSPGIIRTPIGDPTPVNKATAYHNQGVSGARTFHVGLNNYTSLNPLFGRMATSASATMIGEATSLDPTFFTYWLGGNDVLAYATAGGEPGVVNGNDITSTPVFQASVSGALDALMVNGAKGVIAGIPSISSAAFFSTVPINGLDIDTVSAAGLNAAYAPLPTITFKTGANNFVVQDPNALGGLRHIQEGEFVLLTASGELPCGLGSQTPIPDSLYLSLDEVSKINSAVETFNNYLKAQANTRGLAFVDIETIFNSYVSGVSLNGVITTTELITGGLFSLDGIHLTPRGNAFLANEVINAINVQYGSTIPVVNPIQYDGVLIP